MPNPLDYTGWDTFKPAVGPGNALLGSALQADPNATYGTVLPYAVDNATGARRFAMPSMLRSFLQGGVDLADGPSTGTVTPDASGTLGLLAGSNVLARGGDGLLAAAGPKLKLDAAAMQVLREMTPGFRAYHGSPHSFSQFDSAKIGTGEGAQAYGHGLYFADNPEVAHDYRNSLSNPQLFIGDKKVGEIGALGRDPVANAANEIHQSGGDVAAAKARVQRSMQARAAGGYGYYEHEAQGVLKAIDDIGSTPVEVRPGGHAYEVQVNADPAHFLDWDKPLSEQSPHVQKALTPEGLGLKPVGPFGEKGYHGWVDETGKRVGPLQTGKPPSYVFDPRETGMSIARGAGSWKPDYAAEALRKAGIPGIRYLDGGSRAGGEGSRNTVVFDPATIAILRKYGIAGLMAGGTAAASGGQSQ